VPAKIELHVLDQLLGDHVADDLALLVSGEELPLAFLLEAVPIAVIEPFADP
jgi:hypothetical protein